MSSVKSEWPTAQKRAYLRMQGIVPYSPVAVRMILLAALITLMLAGAEGWRAIWHSYTELYNVGLQPQPDSEAAPWRVFSDRSIIMFLVFAFSALLVVLLCIVGASRFLFLPSLICMDLSRLSWGRVLGGVSLSTRLAAGIAAAVVSIGAGALIWRLYSREVFSLLNLPAQRFVEWPAEFLRANALFWLTALLMISFGTWLISWCLFMLRHRMTRAELMAEGTE